MAESTRLLTCLGQFLMVLSIALLIAPSMQHRIVEGGEDSNRIHRATTLYAGWALLPFEISLGIGAYVIFDHLYGRTAALITGTIFCLTGGIFLVRTGSNRETLDRKKENARSREANAAAGKNRPNAHRSACHPARSAGFAGFPVDSHLDAGFEQLPEHIKFCMLPLFAVWDSPSFC